MLDSGDENNPVYDIVYAFKLLLYLRGNNPSNASIQARMILPKVQGIFSSKSTAECFFYFCIHGAATAWTLQCQLEIPETTAYATLKRLRSLGFVSPAIRIPKVRRSKGGPRTTVWALEDATSEDVTEALKLHHRMLSPKYRVAEEAAQSILDEYITPRRVREITYREILIQVRELEIPFSVPDIAELAARYLHERGVKVWR